MDGFIMKKTMFLMTFMTLILSGCMSYSSSKNKCENGGINCDPKNLDEGRPPNPSPSSNCAADGPNCKQYNPNKM